MPRKFAWASSSDESLLQLRLKDLHVGFEGTWLEDCLKELHRELRKRGVRIKPHAWISDEWFSPDTTPGIAIPFYLTHPRLMRLERKKIIDVEGGSIAECMAILRHEAGHAVQHSYQLHRRPEWQKMFGRSSTPYPTHYRPNPASKRYVQHLRLWYAQSHPDEDFAETFAVWLRPRSNWRKRYAGWPALKKLRYVDRLMAEIAHEKPVLTKRLTVDPLKDLDRTLAEHYRRKQARYALQPHKTYDRDLKRIFASDAEHRSWPAASRFLRQNRRLIRQMVARRTGEYQLTLDAILDEMIVRSRELKLRAVGPAQRLRVDFAALLTARMVHSILSPSRPWVAL